MADKKQEPITKQPNRSVTGPTAAEVRKGTHVHASNEHDSKDVAGTSAKPETKSVGRENTDSGAGAIPQSAVNPTDGRGAVAEDALYRDRETGGKFRQFLNLLFGSAPLANGQMLQQFFTLLDASFRTFHETQSTSEMDEHKADRLQRIQELLSPPYSWRKAYHIEQLMVPLYGPDTIDSEVRRRLEEAERHDIPRAQVYKDANDSARSITMKQKLLGDLTDDLQWFYTQRYLRREYARMFSFRLSAWFALALTLFLVVVLGSVVPESRLYDQNEETAIEKQPLDTHGIVPPSTPELTRNADQRNEELSKRPFYALWLVLASGFLGAAFSMLIQSQSRIAGGNMEELVASTSWRSILVRTGVGLGAALILLFFFESRLLEGSIWPDLNNLAGGFIRAGDQHHPVPNTALCLLVIWSVIAGFSESLVPNLLLATEAKATNNTGQ